MLVFSILALLATVKALPSQLPFGSVHPSNQQLSHPVIPQIETWALNPSGDAALIKLSANRNNHNASRSPYDLHLLAINAQFQVPAVVDGPTHAEAEYIFIDDATFLTVEPAPLSPHRWEIRVRGLNYTVTPPAYPPHAEAGDIIGDIEIRGEVGQLLWVDEAKVLAVKAVRQGSGYLALFQLYRQDGRWNAKPFQSILHETNLNVEDVVSSRSSLAFSAKALLSDANTSAIYSIDLTRPFDLLRVGGLQTGKTLAPAFIPGGKLAWLEEKAGHRELWIFDGATSKRVELNWSLNPTGVVSAKDGTALYLFATQRREQALYHIRTNLAFDHSDILSPALIPSSGSIQDAIHVGITPLNHSHLIGRVTYQTGKGLENTKTELWVISHSPGADPTDNFEQVQLTHFMDI